MPLQPEVLKRIQEQTREQFVAYMAGFRDHSKLYVSMNASYQKDHIIRGFSDWYRREQRMLAEYVTWNDLDNWYTVEIAHEQRLRDYQSSQETSTSIQGNSERGQEGSSGAITDGTSPT